MEPNHASDREPREGETITGVDPRITVLPDPADVFVADQPWLARLLHPLVSIELNAFDPKWEGRVHLLSPVEPMEGLLGEATAEHHDEFACENWISFHVEPDGRYRFLGSRLFFELEAAEEEGSSSLDDLREFYAQSDAEYSGTKVRWARLGKLGWGDPENPTKQRIGSGTDCPLIDELGGDLQAGNWASFPPPSAFELEEDDDYFATLRLADGRPFMYIGCTSGYPWRNQGADAIVLFFEPETRTAVLTFDWS